MKSISESIQRWLEYPRKELIIHLQPIPFNQNGNILMCLVVAIAQTQNTVAVKGGSNSYFYPDREQTGIAYRAPKELITRKMHLKAGDNFGFMKELSEFVHDK